MAMEGPTAMTIHQPHFDFPEAIERTTIVSACCRNCDMEADGRRINLYAVGWSDFVWERDLQWTWFDFSAVCPNCLESER
jgi:hypothetical protein